MISRFTTLTLVSIASAFVLSSAAPCRCQDAAEEFNPQLTNSFSLEVKARLESAGELLAIPRVTVQSEAGQFTLLLASGYRIDSTDQRQATFAGENYDRFITFRIIDRLLPTAEPLHHAEFRSLIAQKFPDASRISETTRKTAGAASVGFDLELPSVEGVRRFARILYVPCGVGTLEITFIANGGDVEKKLQDLGRVLLTLRTAKPGEELVVNQLSSRL